MTRDSFTSNQKTYLSLEVEQIYSFIYLFFGFLCVDRIKSQSYKICKEYLFSFNLLIGVGGMYSYYIWLIHINASLQRARISLLFPLAGRHEAHLYCLDCFGEWESALNTQESCDKNIVSEDCEEENWVCGLESFQTKDGFEFNCGC